MAYDRKLKELEQIEQDFAVHLASQWESNMTIMQRIYITRLKRYSTNVKG